MNQGNGKHYNELGNQAFAIKTYDEACRYYRQAMSCDPNNAVYYCNLSRCLLKLKCYNDALEDAVNASTIDPKYPRGYQQLVECYLANGNYGLARHAYKQLEELGFSANLPELLHRIDQLDQSEQQLIELYKGHDYHKALKLTKSITERSPVNRRVLSIQIEILLKLKSFDEAEEIYYDYLCSEEHQIEVKYLRALFKYYRNELDISLELCKEITDEDPDFIKAVKLFKMIKKYKDRVAAGNRAFGNGDYAGADKLYSDGLLIDPSNELALVKLYVNKTIANMKMNKYAEAIESSTLALNIDSNNLKALVNRAEACINVGKKDVAITDYMKAYEISKDEEIFVKLEKLKVDEKGKKEESAYDIQSFLDRYKDDKTNHKENSSKEKEENKDKAEDKKIQRRLIELQETLRKMKTMKPHEILGISQYANEKEIQKGHSNCIRKYHPDHVAKFPQLKQISEEITKNPTSLTAISTITCQLTAWPLEDARANTEERASKIISYSMSENFSMIELHPPSDPERVVLKIRLQIKEGKLKQAEETVVSFNKQYPYRPETRPLYKFIQNLKKATGSIERDINKCKFEQALKKIQVVENDMPNCQTLIVYKIESTLVTQGTNDEASIIYEDLICESFLHTDDDKASRLYINSLMYYYGAQFDVCVETLKELFKYDENHCKGKLLYTQSASIDTTLTEVDAQANKEDYQNALRGLENVRSHDQHNKGLLRVIVYKKAQIFLKMKLWKEADKCLDKLKNLGCDCDNPEYRKMSREIQSVKLSFPPNDMNLPDYFAKITNDNCIIISDCITKMNPHQILGFHPDSVLTSAIIGRTVRRLMKRFHPDLYVNIPALRECSLVVFDRIKEAEVALLATIVNTAATDTLN
ncbi:hypothetical protein CHUAL_013091 [Chamberlinius hualienensis]